MTLYEQELLGAARFRLLNLFAPRKAISFPELAIGHFPVQEMPPASSLFFLGDPEPVTEPDKWDDPEYRKQYCGLLP